MKFSFLGGVVWSLVYHGLLGFLYFSWVPFQAIDSQDRGVPAIDIELKSEGGVDIRPRFSHRKLRSNGGSTRHSVKQPIIGTSNEEGSTEGEVYQPAPTYPSEARMAELEGDLLVEITTDPQGFVESLIIKKSTGHAVLDEHALSILKTWRLSGQQKVLVPLSFRLQ